MMRILRNRTDDVFRAMCESVSTSMAVTLPDFADTNDARAGVTAFVRLVTATAPCHIRIGISSLAVLFDCWSWVRTGSRFSNASAQAQRGLMMTWRESRLRTLRDFIRYVESLAVFYLASRLHRRVDIPAESP